MEKPAGAGPCTIFLTELARWLVIVIPIYLSLWRYTIYKGYTIIIPEADEQAQFWGMMTAFILGGTLVIYLPVKAIGMCWRYKHDKLNGLTWRPSVIIYNFLCAGPCFVLILYGAKTKEPPEDTMDSVTVVILQAMVLGLTFTEWMSKVREEEVTYDLISAMAEDFFFAYDVIEFISMSTRENHIYNSNWVYVCFSFAFISMFKYVPAQPTSISGEGGAPKGATAYILCGMILCDLPFVVIRISTLAIYGFDVSDLIHPVKNIAMIIFDCTQLYIIHRTIKDVKANKAEPTFKQKRRSRNPEWLEENAIAIETEMRNGGSVRSTGGRGGGDVELTDVEDHGEAVSGTNNVGYQGEAADHSGVILRKDKKAATRFQ